VSLGQTFISVENSGITKFIRVAVHEKDNYGLPAEDKTSEVSITSSGFRRDPRNTGLFSQQVVIENLSTLPLAAPLELVVFDLSSRIIAKGNNGVTAIVLPLGTPTYHIKLPTKTTRRPFLSPGETATVTLSFDSMAGLPITYTPKLYAGGRN
jgi:hypothetical protein